MPHIPEKRRPPAEWRKKSHFHTDYICLPYSAHSGRRFFRAQGPPGLRVPDSSHPLPFQPQRLPLRVPAQRAALPHSPRFVLIQNSADRNRRSRRTPPLPALPRVPVRESVSLSAPPFRWRSSLPLSSSLSFKNPLPLSFVSGHSVIPELFPLPFPQPVPSCGQCNPSPASGQCSG